MKTNQVSNRILVLKVEYNAAIKNHKGAVCVVLERYQWCVMWAKKKASFRP